ncbi:MAG: SDR family NAD(P)-dependent oxidoreductase [Chloroflexota bacterium]
MSSKKLDEVKHRTEESPQTLVLVTGATAGIGAATATTLAEAGYAVIVHGRSEARCARVVEAIQTQGGTARADLAEFSSFTQVHALADRLASQNIDIVINNAGVWMNEARETEDGFEMTWQVNYLAPFLLTLRLLPTLLQRANARVINISSSGHHSGRIHFDDVNLRHGFSDIRAYCQSKLANVLFTQELARRTQGTSLITHAIDPGAVTTQLLARTGFSPPAAKPAEETVERWLTAVLGPEGGRSSGDYFGPNGKRSEPSTHDTKLAARLWSMSESQIATWANLAP